MIETKTITIGSASREFSDPITTTWKGVKMIRSHSPSIMIHKMVQYAKRLDYVKLGIIGEPHTGKTELSKFIAHFFHKMAEDEIGVKFRIKIFTREELLNFKKSIEKLEASNWILIFDDVSWIEKEGTPQQINEIKAGESMIRHFKDKKDVKIFQIDNYHYTKGENKYLRQSHFKIFTSVGSEETDNINTITNNRFPYAISNFEKIQSEMYGTGTISLQIGRSKRTFQYFYRDPFIPILFWDRSTLSFKVTPLREWMDKGCSLCSSGVGLEQADFSLLEYKKYLEERFTPTIAKNGVKIKMREYGYNTYRPELSRCVDNIAKKMSEHNFDLLQFGEMFGLKLTQPTRKTKLDDFVKDPTKREEKAKETVSDKNFGEIISWEEEEPIKQEKEENKVV